MSENISSLSSGDNSNEINANSWSEVEFLSESSNEDLNSMIKNSLLRVYQKEYSSIPLEAFFDFVIKEVGVQEDIANAALNEIRTCQAKETSLVY